MDCCHDNGRHRSLEIEKTSASEHAMSRNVSRCYKLMTTSREQPRSRTLPRKPRHARVAGRLGGKARRRMVMFIYMTKNLGAFVTTPNSPDLRVQLGRNLTHGLLDALGRAIVTGRYDDGP